MAMILRFCDVGFCSRCPVGSSGAVSLIIWSRSSRNDTCVSYVAFPIVTGSWLLLSDSLNSSTHGLLDSNWPRCLIFCTDACACLSPSSSVLLYINFQSSYTSTGFSRWILCSLAASPIQVWEQVDGESSNSAAVLEPLLIQNLLHS